MIGKKDTDAEAVVYRAERVLIDDHGCLRDGAGESVGSTKKLVPEDSLGLISLRNHKWNLGYPGFSKHPEILRPFSMMVAEVGLEDRSTMADLYEQLANLMNIPFKKLLVIEASQTGDEASQAGIEAARQLGCTVLDSVNFDEINAFIAEKF